MDFALLTLHRELNADAVRLVSKCTNELRCSDREAGLVVLMAQIWSLCDNVIALGKHDEAYGKHLRLFINRLIFGNGGI